MAKSILASAYFHNESAAYEFVESLVWPNGPRCPHCKGIDRISKMQGYSTRIGTYKCYSCRKPFTVKIGTIFEGSHISLRIWLQAIYLICASKKGCSANQLHRTLGVTLKTAWFMGHRIREAMRQDGLQCFGFDGGVVEADETFIGIDPNIERGKAGYRHKCKVLSLLDRSSGRTFSLVIDDLKVSTIYPILQENIEYEARVLTDDAVQYGNLKHLFSRHDVVNHTAGEYVSLEDPTIHTNTIEGYFSIFKRGMKGVYQHCKKHHLHRYLAEFDFRYNHRAKNGYTDEGRAEEMLKGVVGRRLTYQTTY